MTFFHIKQAKIAMYFTSWKILLQAPPATTVFFHKKSGLAFKKQSASIIYFSNNIDVDPKFYFSNKLSTARPGAVKESILQLTGCLRYGRHDIFTFFRM